MKKIIVATGIESAIAKSWTGWDGDIENLMFYGVKLLPQVLAYCQDKGLVDTNEVYLDINTQDLTARIYTFDKDSNNESWELTLNLKISVLELE